MTRNRFDETWHRLRDWTKGQTPSERLSGQILIHEGFKNFDPSHPLGGQDGGKDGLAVRDGKRFVMAVYFPRGQKIFNKIKEKFAEDLLGVSKNSADGIAFVTNQELKLGEREDLKSIGENFEVELFHLERITAILDTPEMAQIREQFLDIRTQSEPVLKLGGEGGKGPGSGGGGGGAIGPGATGGAGGPGGEIHLHGSPGESPGAGGGGTGAVGKGAVGGEGGGGGETVVVEQAVRLTGSKKRAHRLDIHIGKGGIGGPGEDTVVNVCDEDGHIIESHRARGGVAGKSGHVPPPSRIPTKDDLQAGLIVSSVVASAALHEKNGLWTIIDGGWDWIAVDTNPFRVELPLLIEIETGSISPETYLELQLMVQSPTGFTVCNEKFLLQVPVQLVRRTRACIRLDFTGSAGGIWHVLILAGEHIMRDFLIEIRMPTDN